MHEVLVYHFGGLSLPRKSVVRLTDHPDMTLDVYRGRKTTKQHDPKGVRAIEVLLYIIQIQGKQFNHFLFCHPSQRL